MKRAVILHAMDQTSHGHWYQWLKNTLESKGYEVWAPDLPHTDHPDTAEMTQFLLSNSHWSFADNLVIGHSSGAVEILYLLQALPVDMTVATAVMIGSFDHMVEGMEAQHDRMFTQPLNFQKIKTAAQKMLFIQGDDDPWCPVEGAQNLARQSDGELIIVPGGKHFSTSLDPAYTKFPKLIEILEEKNLL